MTTNSSPFICPKCSNRIDLADDGHPLDVEHKPTPDNITVCIHCAECVVFNKDMSLRSLTDEDTKDLGIALVFTIFAYQLKAAEMIEIRKRLKQLRNN